MFFGFVQRNEENICIDFRQIFHTLAHFRRLIHCPVAQRRQDFITGIICMKCQRTIKGQFRSFDKHDEDKNRLILSVFALAIDLLGEIDVLGEDISYKNKIELTGFICKEPTYRATPYEREISDVLLAVNRSYGKSDFIPCICWERNALFASDLAVGTQVELTGRIQSRKFEKRISDDEYEERIAYEVSASTICVIGGEEDDCIE